MANISDIVDELKAERDDKGEAQQHVGPGGERVDAREVVRQLRPGVEEAGYENQSENEKTNAAVRFVSGLFRKRTCRDLRRSNCDRSAFIHKGKNAVKNIVGAAGEIGQITNGSYPGKAADSV